MDEKSLYEYARLTLKYGVNLQNGQGVELACPVELDDAAVAFTKAAYDMGASVVRLRWEDDRISRLNLIHADINELSTVPKWIVDSKNELVKNNFCYVAIAAEDPAAFSDVPDERISVFSRSRRKALKRFSESVMVNDIRWCVISLPTEKWAKTVFPNSATPLSDLENAILKTMRLDRADPDKAWESHIAALTFRAAELNKHDFDRLIFKNAKGTNLSVGLADGHVWLSAKERAKDGVCFMANMPTEEVFTAPHRARVDGIVYSALPLSYNGQIINEFSLRFKKGKIIDFAAKEGYEALKSLIETDDGTRRLGEVALIGKNSPIAQSGILFYNTLFDENASCHIAIGKAYPTTVSGGERQTKAQLKARGVNDSIEHVDFMIGTEDLSVTGVKKDGSKIVLFEDGEWSF